MPTDPFEFDAYLSDYVQTLRRIAADEGWSLSQTMQRFLRELERDVDLRDTTFEDYAAAGSLSPSMSVSKGTPGLASFGGFVTIVFDTLDWQATDAFEWDGASTLTASAPGIVQIIALARFATTAVATLWNLRALQNGTEIGGTETRPSSAETRLTVPVLTRVVEGDTITVECQHDDPAGVNVQWAKLQVVFLGQRSD